MPDPPAPDGDRRIPPQLTDKFRTFAVIDIGSNSIRLVIFNVTDGYPHPLYNERVFCGLGTGLGATGALPDDAMDRAVEAVVRFSRLARDNGVDRLDAFATSAVRDAANGGGLISSIHAMTGCEVNILDGQEDALRGGLYVKDGIIADLGGGSLELAVLRHGKTREMISLPLGTMRLQARLSGDMKKMQAAVDTELDAVEWLGDHPGGKLFPIGGAWRAFARLKIVESNYPLNIIHGYTVPADSALQTATLLTGLSKQSAMSLENVVRQRRQSMPLTGLILRALINRAQPADITFSAVGVREGYVYDQMPSSQIAEDPLVAAASALAERDGRFGNTAERLLTWLRDIIPAENLCRRRLQIAVCAISDIAWREHPDYRASFAFDRAIQYPFFGLTHSERAFIALAVYLRYGGRPDDARVASIGSLLSKRAIRRAETLGYGLRLAYRISAGNPEFLDRSRLAIVDDGCRS